MKRWFLEMKVVHKLMLMSIFFLLPDSMMLYLLVSGINDNIQFTRQELKGNQYLRPLVHMQHLLPIYERLAVKNSDPASQANVKRSIDQCLGRLDAVDRQYAVDLQFTDEALASRDRRGAKPASLIADWEKLCDESHPLDTSAREVVFGRLMNNVRLMVRHTGDMSNLILDPDLDTYYMMDATLLSLPKDQDELSRTLTDGEQQILQNPSQPNHSGVTLAGMHAANLRDADLDHLVNSVKTALREDNSFYGVSPEFQRLMPPALDSYISAVTPFIEMTERLDHSAGKAPITSSEYRAAGERARDAGMALWDVSTDQLDGLLKTRLDYYVHRRLMSLSITAMSIVAASLLVTFINRSINRPLIRQADQLLELNSKLLGEMKERRAAQAALVEASHTAGMAEIATGVLHNVGNVLNSVNTSTTLIREKIERSKMPVLRKATALISEHRSEMGTWLSQDPRGRLIPDLLTNLSGVLNDEQSMMTAELDHLSRNLEHIKQIVHSQQAFAKISQKLEELDLVEALTDALRINGLENGAFGIEVIRNFEPCPPVMTEKHKLLQILVNLISNAKKAILESQSSTRQLTVQLSRTRGGYRSVARICVIDTGVGIGPDNLKKIFQHGFTTRKDGHGFGLHTAAIDAHQMGGTLVVTSAGIGKGATFCLDVPFDYTDLKEDIYGTANSYSR